VLNAASIRMTAIASSVGVVCELVGVALVVVLLFSKAERGPGVVLQTINLSPSTGYFGPLLVSSLMAAYVLVGFDSAGELSEETHSPRRIAPRTILRAVAASGFGGALLIVAALMAAPSLTDGKLASQGLPYVLTSRLGTVTGKLLLLDVAIAIFVCTLAIQTSASRMIFSMARDKVLPFSTRLAAVSRRTHTPLAPTVAAGVIAAALLAVNVGNPALFLALTSVCIMLMYLAYLMVTVPMLIQRLRGGLATDECDETGRPLFSLGRWGIPVNLVAVIYGLAMAVNLGWPRAEVFDPEGGHWYLRFLGPIVLGATALLGLLAYAVQRHEYHAAIGTAPVRPRLGRPALANEEA
ncbi:MAG TPA: APC family permease, partial [Pseudonocardia sp.]